MLSIVGAVSPSRSRVGVLLTVVMMGAVLNAGPTVAATPGAVSRIALEGQGADVALSLTADTGGTRCNPGPSLRSRSKRKPTIWASVNRFFIVRPLRWAGL